MTKRLSEGFLGAALRQIDLVTHVYKPPDQAGNWKPCDYLVWVKSTVRAHAFVDVLGTGEEIDTVDSFWFEAKDEKALETFNWRLQMRPAQLQGIRDAERVGIPYYLAVYWRRHREWTISDAVKLYHATRVKPDGTGGVLSFKRRAMGAGGLGIDSSPGQLSSVLKAVVLGELL